MRAPATFATDPPFARLLFSPAKPIETPRRRHTFPPQKILTGDGHDRQSTAPSKTNCDTRTRRGDRLAGANALQQSLNDCVAITDGQLHLGPWEHIFYYEFDGRRRKRILIKIIGH